MKRTLTLMGMVAVCHAGLAQADPAGPESEPEEASAPTVVEPVREPDGDEAQNTESTTNAPAEVQLSEETHIRSESVDLGIKSRTAVYRGNVRLDDPRLHLTCEYLFANIPETGQVDHIIAETNVVIRMLDDKGLTNWAYADKAVYTYRASALETNELVELTGSPRIEREEHILYGDTIVWDRARDEIRATNQRMGPRRESPAPASTNQPPDEGSGGEAGVSESPDSPADE